MLRGLDIHCSPLRAALHKGFRPSGLRFAQVTLRNVRGILPLTIPLGSNPPIYATKYSTMCCILLRGLDLNQRPPGYGPGELPDCSTPRDYSTSACLFCQQLYQGHPTTRKRNCFVYILRPMKPLNYSCHTKSAAGVWYASILL